MGRSADTAKSCRDTQTLTAVTGDTSLTASAFTVKWTSADLLDDLHRLVSRNDKTWMENSRNGRGDAKTTGKLCEYSSFYAVDFLILCC